MQKLSSYRIVIHLSALLLITGLALPAGLCAGHLVDFNRNSHGAEMHGSDMSHQDHNDVQEEENCHSSDPELPDTNKVAHHDCKDGADCTCHFDQAPIKDQKWVVTTGILITDLAAATTVVREDHADYSRYHFAHPEPYTAPPIFILNSTFLN